MLPLSKCGNAGRIAQWILGNIGDPLDYWQHGNGVTSAKSCVKLATGDTVVTLENKWWGVRGYVTNITIGSTIDPLLAIWNLRHVWAPVWLRDKFSPSWGVRVSLSLLTPFYWDEECATKRLREVLPHKVC